MKNRVVITGLGAVTPIGIGKDNFWTALVNGRNGIGRITRFDPAEFPCQLAGEVNDFNPDDFIDKKESKRMDRFTQFAVAASHLAVDDSKLDLNTVDRNRFGVYIGAGIGGMDTLHNQYQRLFEKGPTRISPFFIPMMIANLAAGQVAIDFKIHGPSLCIVTACASGTDCIGEALRAIQHGYADIMLAGGTESAVSPAGVAGFCTMKALCVDHNDDPAHASRPFDKNRSGFIMGEGAGIVLLESLDHALKRGAHIYAELCGYGQASDAYHITGPAPNGEFQGLAMQRALDDAQLKPDQIDYINAHGTSTHLNDACETQAIKTVFGDHAHKLAVSSIKSMTGHLLGAAGGIECIATALTIERGIIPPTINYDTPDDGLDLDYVPNTAREQKVDAALSNSFGFGGQNACVALKRFAD